MVLRCACAFGRTSIVTLDLHGPPIPSLCDDSPRVGLYLEIVDRLLERMALSNLREVLLSFLAMGLQARLPCERVGG